MKDCSEDQQNVLQIQGNYTVKWPGKSMIRTHKTTMLITLYIIVNSTVNFYNTTIQLYTNSDCMCIIIIMNRDHNETFPMEV